MKPYRPKRAGLKWLEGAPAHVWDCFDTGEGSTRRYCVFLGGSFFFEKNRSVFMYYVTTDGTDYHADLCGGHLSSSSVANYRLKHRKNRCKWKDMPDEAKKKVTAFCNHETS